MRITKKRKEFLYAQLAKDHALGALVDLDCPDHEFVECYGVSKKEASEALKALVESIRPIGR